MRGRNGRHQSLLIDRSALFRQGVRSLLPTMEDIGVIEEAATGGHGLALVGIRLPNVTLLDINLPDSFALADQLGRDFPAVPLIF